MTEFIEIQWTSGSLDEARKVARYLVQEHLAACVQIIPWLESVYMWNNQLETAQESKVMIKTRRELYEKLKKIIQQNCKYEVPEITFQSIEGGNQEYLEWMAESIGQDEKRSR